MAMLPTGEKWPKEDPPVYNFYNNIDNSNKNTNEGCKCCCKCCNGETPTPEPEEWTEYDGGWADTPDATYDANKDHWLDGGDADGKQTEEVDGGDA